jgi:bifunctional ADP-heptose synthase (sugar kinase/adenylyltransferase)
MKEKMMSQQPKSLKILLLGDSCYDYYHYGKINRISPEAPIPILDYSHEIVKPGMAANVKTNLEALGADVHLITAFLENKRRYIDSKSMQQVLRVDERVSNNHCSKEDIPDMRCVDAVVISDYDKGFLSYDIIRHIRDNYHGPVFMDTKKTDLAEFDDFIVKINHLECKKLYTRPKNLIVTHGGETVIWHKPYPDAGQIFFPPKVESFDVCGAGDTFLASLVYSYIQNDGDLEKSIIFAMKAAAITVQKTGVYAPTLKEILNEKS